METEIARDGTTEEEEAVLPFDEELAEQEPEFDTPDDGDLDDADLDDADLDDADLDDADRLENIALGLLASLRAERQLEEQAGQPSKQRIKQRSGLEWLTVERLLYGLIVAVAALIRLLNLGALPLSTLEAANAWTAWIAVLGDGIHIGPGTETAAPIASSALLYSLHASVLWLVGGGDALVRFLPALFGIALVLLPWFWRATIGRQMALVAALLLAVDPWLVAYSRLADGVILSIFFGLLTLTGLHLLVSDRITHEQRTRWQMATAISAGLLLVSGTQTWSMVLVLALFVLFFDVNVATLLANASAVDAVHSDPTGSEASKDGSSADFAPEAGSAAKVYGTILSGPDSINKSLRITPLIALVAAAVLGSTAWLARLEGVGYVSSSISFWVTQLAGAQGNTSLVANGPYSISWVLLRLLGDQPLLVFFGTSGLILAMMTRNSQEQTVEQKRWMSVLLGWLLVGLFLLLLPGRGPFSLFMIGLPLLVAAASMLNRIISVARVALGAMDSWILFGLLVILALVWISSVHQRFEYQYNSMLVSV